MGGKSSGQTSTTSNAPPAQYLQAYQQVMDKANNVAATPYQNYTGQLQAGFSPMQQQGFDVIGSSAGVQAPYINAAAQDFSNVNAPLQPQMQGYIDAGTREYNAAADANLPNALLPYQGQAAQGFGAGSQTLTPQQYSGAAIQSYESPYTKSVVDATQNQFNLSNATQQAQLQGNAASQGALGGDRVGVAQAALAGQQQAQQAPIIAGLENQGFTQAQNEFNNQQQTNLTAQQQSEALKQQAAQGYAGLAGQAMTAAQQQAAIQMQAGQGFVGEGQQELGAAQSQGWLNAQAGSGLAGLGNQALSGTLASGNALLSAGGQQQQQAQQSLNIPYEQWQAALSYPYQSTGWLANIAEGLGGASGSTGTSTTPGPSTGSQLLGGGVLAGAGLYGTGAFGSDGYLTNLFGSGAASAGNVANSVDGSGLGNILAEAGQNRGGSVGFAGGGGVPDVSVNGVNVGQAPGSQSVLAGGNGVPEVSTSIVPGASGFGSAPTSNATSLLKRNYGTTTTSSGGGSSGLLGLVNSGIGLAVGSATGNPFAGMATSAGLNATGLRRGGQVHGFAAGGAPAVNVSTVANARGVGVPVMTVDPSVTGGGVSSSDPGSSLNTYLNQTAAGASHAAPTSGPPPAAPLTADQQTAANAIRAFNAAAAQYAPNLIGQYGFSDGGNGTMKTGGTVRGFDGGGDVDDADGFVQPTADFGHVTNQPVGQKLSDWLFGRARDADGQVIPTPPTVVPESTGGGFDFNKPLAKQIPDFLNYLAKDHAASQAAFDKETRQPTTTSTNPPETDDAPTPDQGQFDQGMLGRGAGDHSALGFGVNPTPDPADQVNDTTADGVTASDPGAAANITTPAGPAGVTTTGNQGPNGPAGPAKPALATGFAGGDSGGNTAVAQPPPPSPGFGAKSAYSDSLAGSRALQEDKANPWLSMAIAGAGMMAGTSPHAMTNIGQGALAGLSNYIKTDQAAKELAAKVMETKASLAATQAYREATIGVNQQKADATTSRAATYAARSVAQNQLAAMKASNPKLSMADVLQKTMTNLTGSGVDPDTGEPVGGVINPDTGKIFTPAEAYLHLKDTNNSAGRLAETTRHNQATESAQNARQAQINQNNAIIAQAKANHDVNAYAAGISRDAALNGKMLPEGEAMRRAQADLGARGDAPMPGSAPAQAPAQQGKPKPTADVLKAAQDAVTGGKDKNAVLARLATQYDISGVTLQ